MKWTFAFTNSTWIIIKLILLASTFSKSKEWYYLFFSFIQVYSYLNKGIHLRSYCTAETSRCNIIPFNRHITTIHTKPMLSCLHLVKGEVQDIYHTHGLYFISQMQISDPDTNHIIGLFQDRHNQQPSLYTVCVCVCACAWACVCVKKEPHETVEEFNRLE